MPASSHRPLPSSTHHPALNGPQPASDPFSHIKPALPACYYPQHGSTENAGLENTLCHIFILNNSVKD